MDEVEKKILNTDDARIWAQEFCKIAKSIDACRREAGEFHDIDEGWMIGWFANAIETAKTLERLRISAAEEPILISNNPGVAWVLQMFVYDHLPEPLRAASRPFAVLASQIALQSSNQETTFALRQLLLAKDAAVRAVRFEPFPRRT